MKLIKLQKRLLSFFTIVTFSLGMIAPDVMHAASNDSDAKLVASILTNSKAAYGNSKTGFKKFSEQALSTMPASDVKFIQSVLPDLSALPDVSYKNGVITVHAEGQDITVKPINASTGEMLVNGKRFTYKTNQSFKKNFDRLSVLFKSAKVSWTDVLMNQIVPSAHAKKDSKMSDKTKNTLIIAIAALVAVVAVGWFVTSAMKKKDDNKTKVDLANVNASIAANNNETRVELEGLSNADAADQRAHDSGESDDGGDGAVY